MNERAHPHDLVRLSPRAVARLASIAPGWTAASLRRAPWAIVRRAYIAEEVPIGIRGEHRSQRFAASVAEGEIDRVVSPERLLHVAPPREHRAFTALAAVIDAADARGLRAAPIGAAGFELATGVPALHEASDLDVIVRAQPSDTALRTFARAIAGLPVRVDVEVAFGDGYAAALDEALRGGELMVKTPSGPRLLPPFSPPHAAVQALIAEAELTPKPALVDRRGSGAHADLTLELLRASAYALEQTFAAVEAAARTSPIDRALRARLGAIGRDGEAQMLAATGGANAHRGAIWAIGLLVAGAANTNSRDPAAIAHAAAQIAALPDPGAANVRTTNGVRVRARYGVRGAVGEAETGFPHVMQGALPALRAARERGASEAVARVDALLVVMATLDDTCLLHRGGEEALRVAQAGARTVLAAGGSGAAAGRHAFAELESALLARRASPGGAADLLAAALFLDSIERGAWV